MGLREAYDPRGALAETPESSRKGTAGAGSGACETGEPGEEARAGYQEERKEWSNGCLQDPGQGSGADETVSTRGAAAVYFNTWGLWG